MGGHSAHGPSAAAAGGRKSLKYTKQGRANPAGELMAIDRRYNRFRLIKLPDDLSRPQAEFMYKLIVKLGGEPGKARWLTFTEVANAAEAAGYKQLLDPSKGVEVPDSVYYWLNNQWSLKGFMMRNEP
jgi:hypothetical protein